MANKRVRSSVERLTLPKSLRIDTATEIHAQLCAVVAAGHPVVVDCAAVTVADTAGVQCLLAAARTASSFRLLAVPPPLAEAIRDLGLKEAMAPYQEGG
jgi:anti-anti-sigma regulatory factor